MSKNDWAKFQKLVRKVHNLYVNQQIKKETKNTKKSLLQYALIDEKDTAQLIATKQLYFWTVSGALENKDALAVVPEWWAIRKGADCPQLVVLFKSTTNPKSYYTLHIPHYDGHKSGTSPISSYKKGNYRGCLTLRDNSKVVCYASSENEAESVLREAEKHIIDKFLIGKTITIGTTKKKNFKTDTVKPISGKFFGSGQMNKNPDWIAYY